MSQNEPKRDDNKENKGGDQQQRSGNQSQQRRPSSRKPLLDPTNIVGAVIWLSSALLTAITVMVIFVKLPAECVGARGQITGCTGDLIRSSQGIGVLVTALVAQVVISQMIHRLRHTHPTFSRVGTVTERMINFIGLYWLICVQLGVAYASGVYETISTFIRTMNVSTLVSWVLLVAASIAWDELSDAFFKAPGGTSGSQPTQRR